MKRLIFIFFVFLISKSYAQYGIQVYHDITLNFLEIIPDARLGGIGEVDVVSSIFYNNTGLYRNAALLSKHVKEGGFNISYMPYLRKVVNDLNYANINAYSAVNINNAIGINYSILDYGKNIFTDESGLYAGEERFYDLYVQGVYSHSFSNSISTGLSAKYIRSVYPKQYNGIKGKLNTFAIDLGFNYDDSYHLSEESFLNTSLGIALSNFGPKVEYEMEGERFLPTKFLLGLFINPDLYINDNLRFNIELGYQAEKYLVPSPPVYDLEGNIIDGYNPDITSFKALYQSFYDAPGGFEEEIHEIMHKFGSEFRLNIGDKAYIALRHGRIIEHETKGNRKYQTFGLGSGFHNFMLDFKIIGFSKYSGLNNTWAITGGYRISLN